MSRRSFVQTTFLLAAVLWAAGCDPRDSKLKRGSVGPVATTERETSSMRGGVDEGHRNVIGNTNVKKAGIERFSERTDERVEYVAEEPSGDTSSDLTPLKKESIVDASFEEGKTMNEEHVGPSDVGELVAELAETDLIVFRGQSSGGGGEDQSGGSEAENLDGIEGENDGQSEVQDDGQSEDQTENQTEDRIAVPTETSDDPSGHVDHPLVELTAISEEPCSDSESWTEVDQHCEGDSNRDDSVVPGDGILVAQPIDEKVDLWVTKEDDVDVVLAPPVDEKRINPKNDPNRIHARPDPPNIHLFEDPEVDDMRVGLRNNKDLVDNVDSQEEDSFGEDDLFDHMGGEFTKRDAQLLLGVTSDEEIIAPEDRVLTPEKSPQHTVEDDNSIGHVTNTDSIDDIIDSYEGGSEITEFDSEEWPATDTESSEEAIPAEGVFNYAYGLPPVLNSYPIYENVIATSESMRVVVGTGFFSPFLDYRKITVRLPIPMDDDEELELWQTIISGFNTIDDIEGEVDDATGTEINIARDDGKTENDEELSKTVDFSIYAMKNEEDNITTDYILYFDSAEDTKDRLLWRFLNDGLVRDDSFLKAVREWRKDDLLSMALEAWKTWVVRAEADRYERLDETESDSEDGSYVDALLNFEVKDMSSFVGSPESYLILKTRLDINEYMLTNVGYEEERVEVRVCIPNVLFEDYVLDTIILLFDDKALSSKEDITDFTEFLNQLASNQQLSSDIINRSINRIVPLVEDEWRLFRLGL